MTGPTFLPNETIEVFDRKMAYAELGQGSPIVFQHGNPTSSYLWRNIGPRLAEYGRCVAVDLIGMGGSDKLPGTGPMRYTFEEQARYLYHAWDQLEVYKDVILVLHGMGAALGFEWARRFPNRVAGIVYMEALVWPLPNWGAWSQEAQDLFKAVRSPDGEKLVLDENIFLEKVLPRATLARLGEAALARYRAPFNEPGEGRRPMLDLPRQIPVAGEPADMAALVEKYGRWLKSSDVPKLLVEAEYGTFCTGPMLEFCRTWNHQERVKLRAAHFVPEDAPDALSKALIGFAQRLRG